MSANNQHLILEHGGKWHVFLSVMAESWDDKNTISIDEADFSGTREECCEYAFNEDHDTEYGVGFFLLKDGAEVTIVEGK